LGGQFAPETGGQFPPDSGGQFPPESIGLFLRIVVVNNTGFSRYSSARDYYSKRKGYLELEIIE
jgi:hypothetical protein